MYFSMISVVYVGSFHDLGSFRPTVVYVRPSVRPSELVSELGSDRVSVLGSDRVSVHGSDRMSGRTSERKNGQMSGASK